MSTPADQIRATFEHWFDESEAKDIEAAMARIAPDVVSYEHVVPLQYTDVPSIQAVCQQGFDAAPHGFRWTVPGLTIVVRDDLAVTWGLNHVRVNQPSGEPIDTYSRGTRVLQRRGERWLMIHQHLSFPLDPATGAARTDLRP